MLFGGDHDPNQMSHDLEESVGSPGHSEIIRKFKTGGAAEPQRQFCHMCGVTRWLWGQPDWILISALSFTLAIDTLADFFQPLLRFSVSKLGILVPSTGSPSVADRG